MRPRVLTGRTILPADNNPEHGGEFTFNRRLHEPGPQKIMDKVYAEADAEQGRAVLRDLAVDPATAAHIAAKLARYFIADEPPAELVARLAKTFHDTSGDLKAVTRALVSAEAAWAEPRTKLKPPSEWILGWCAPPARCRSIPSASRPGRTCSASRCAPALTQGVRR